MGCFLNHPTLNKNILTILEKNISLIPLQSELVLDAYKGHLIEMVF